MVVVENPPSVDEEGNLVRRVPPALGWGGALTCRFRQVSNMAVGVRSQPGGAGAPK
jgi:hypothetical protein